MSSIGSIYTSGTYHANNPDWHLEHSAWKATHVLAMLRKHAIAPESVCDYGCGAGGVLRSIASQLPGAKVLHGYDPSPQASAWWDSDGSSRLSFSATATDVLNRSHPFDVLLLLDVMEHVEDYFTLLRTLRHAARYKLVHIPLEITAQAALRGIPEKSWLSCGHIHHFNRATALHALRESGHHVVDDVYTINSEAYPPKTLRQRLRATVSQAVFAFAPNAAARFLSGYSLLVLTT